MYHTRTAKRTHCSALFDNISGSKMLHVARNDNKRGATSTPISSIRFVSPKLDWYELVFIIFN